jgi:hypothetical protein
MVQSMVEGNESKSARPISRQLQVGWLHWRHHEVALRSSGCITNLELSMRGFGWHWLSWILYTIILNLHYAPAFWRRIAYMNIVVSNRVYANGCQHSQLCYSRALAVGVWLGQAAGGLRTHSCNNAKHNVSSNLFLQWVSYTLLQLLLNHKNSAWTQRKLSVNAA